MEFVDILIIVLLLIASVLGLYLIKLVKRLFITIDFVENEIRELDAKITPLLSEIEKIADTGNSVVSFVKEQTDYANDIAQNLKNKFGGLVSKKDVKHSSQSNAQSLVTNLRAIVKGAVSFINELK